MSTESGSVFPARTATLLVWGMLLAFLVTLFFMIFGSKVPDVDPGRPDSYGFSAIGHRALVRLLEQEVAVTVSRGDSASRATPEVPLLLLEPRSSQVALEQLEAMVVEALGRRAPVVVVLPKWRGRLGGSRHNWVGRVQPLDEEVPRRVLTAALGGSSWGRGDKERAILRPVEVGPVSRDTVWAGSLGGDGMAPPSLPLPQLIPEDERYFEPLLAHREGLLVARSTAAPLYVVTDPDLLNTSGLARGDNAAYVYRLLLDHLQPEALVVAEEIHGYAVPASVWSALLRPPLALLTLHLALLTALVVWAATGRFGRPVAAPSRVTTGTATLVENTALLLGAGGHFDESADRYLDWTVWRAARRFSVPRVGGRRQLVARLAALGRRRGVSVDLEEIARGVVVLVGRGKNPQRARQLVRELYRWRKELEDG